VKFDKAITVFFEKCADLSAEDYIMFKQKIRTDQQEVKEQ